MKHEGRPSDLDDVSVDAQLRDARPLADQKLRANGAGLPEVPPDRSAGWLAGSGEGWWVGHAGAVGEGDGEVAVGGVEAEVPAAFVHEVVVAAA
jgi:hypothetical protein